MTTDPQTWHLDLEHVGQLCQRVRLGRDVSGVAVARAAGLAPSTVHRFEAHSAGSPTTVERYLRALADSPPYGPLTDSQVGFLREAVADSHARRRREADLAPLDLALARRRPEFERLVSRLRAGGLPGGVTDGLGFVHVANWPVLHLFGIDQDDEFLSHWHAWHMVGRSVGPRSPMLRLGDPHDQVPKWSHAFLWFVRRYLFTRQCNALVARLADLMPDVFPGAWRAATGLLLPYGSNLTLRSADYGGAIVAVEVRVVERVELQLAPGCATAFTLGVWQPISDGSRQVLDTLAADRRGGDLYFACDFDRRADFHVNAWPPRPDAPDPTNL